MAFIRPGIAPGGLRVAPRVRVVPRMAVPRPPGGMPTGVGGALQGGTGGGPGPLGDLRSGRPTGPPIMRKKGGGVSAAADRKQDRLANLRRGRARSGR